MQFIDKSKLYPIAEFSGKVTANIYWLKKEYWGIEENIDTRIANACHNLDGENIANISCPNTLNKRLVLGRHFSKMEQVSSKYNFDRSKYINLLVSLVSLDKEELVANHTIKPLTGVDTDLHIVYSAEMVNYCIAILKHDDQFQRIFYKRFIPKNKSIMLLLEITPEQVYLFGIGKFLDIFRFSTDYCAIMEGQNARQ